jgi:DNA-binding IclR family transcriptional regulator
VDFFSAESGVQSSIEILELIAEKPLTFEEIADEMDMNPNTITQNLML